MMNQNSMIYCLIAFILGYLVYSHMGNGFRIGGISEKGEQKDIARIQAHIDYLSDQIKDVMAVQSKYNKANLEARNKLESDILTKIDNLH